MADLGNKHECLSCGTKFYDLGRSQLVCPGCGGDQEELAEGPADEDQATGKSSSGKAKKAKKNKKTETAETDDEPTEEAEEALLSEEAEEIPSSEE
jgi:uncharacterized protein (TIGR02300 family)